DQSTFVLIEDDYEVSYEDKYESRAPTGRDPERSEVKRSEVKRQGGDEAKRRRETEASGPPKDSGKSEMFRTSSLGHADPE
ncbi:MAG: hypothetical protein M1838_005232, partial [Thelocarpon superellum]